MGIPTGTSLHVKFAMDQNENDGSSTYSINGGLTSEKYGQRRYPINRSEHSSGVGVPTGASLHVKFAIDQKEKTDQAHTGKRVD